MDSSGEVISIEGMDISSLDKSGVFNWEHLKDSPGQVVGKILKAKKIFSEKDCEDDRQKYFWNKCTVPYIYVMGELFDDYKDSAKEVAGLFRYDADKEGMQEVDVVGFSIEGQYLQREGSVVTRSIARKCTITTANCNKMALAKMVPVKKPKDDIDSLFKTDFVPNAEIFKGEIASIKKDEGFTMGTLNASEKTSIAKKPHLGATKSGKPVLTQGIVGEYKGFSSQDHRDAAELHLDARVAAHKAGDFKQQNAHNNKYMLHSQAANTALDKESRASKALPSMSRMIKSEQIGSDLMTDEESDSLLNRTEDKYFVSKTALDYLTQKIKENLKEGDIDTEVRYNTNRSIYLDNKDLDSLKDAMNSVKPRIKIRVRQYSPNSKDWEQVAYVEIKAKEEDGNSNKMRVRIHAKDIDSFCAGEPIQCNEDLANINKDVTKIILEKRISYINRLVALYGFRRQVEVRYERRAYTNKDIRITIDDNLRFVRSNLISDENILAVKCTAGWVNILQLDHQLKNEGYVIMEVKHQGKVPGWVKDCLKSCNAKEVKFSKYCAATACVIEAKQISGFVSAATILREGSELNKALDAGSAMAAPSALVGGAALGKESLQGAKKAKSKWLTRAEQEYNSWTKREEFEKFMAKRMPNLTKGEIRAIGQVMALNKSMNLEKSLSDLLINFKF